MKKYLWILILAVIVVAVFVMRDRRPTDEEVKSYSEMTAREVALTCTTDMATEFHIFDHVVDDTHEIVVTVNGGRVETYENTLLVDKDRIVISYQAK